MLEYYWAEMKAAQTSTAEMKAASLAEKTAATKMMDR